MSEAAARRIAIVDGHPDADAARFVHALADGYAAGADAAGHEVRRIDVARLEFPLLATRREWEGNDLPADILTAQETIAWCNHLVVIYPLWLGDMPALLKGFFEQALRPGFAFHPREGGLPGKALKGRSAHVFVTMGMPAIFYRVYYGAHSVKSLERNILRFVGFRPVRHTLIGNVEGDAAMRADWLEQMRRVGENGA